MARRSKAAESDPITPSRCELCFTNQQGRRHLHFLKEDCYGDLFKHLREQYGDEPRARDGVIAGVLAWVATIKQEYSGYVDEQTGAVLPAWKTWARMQLAATRRQREMEVQP